MIVGKGGEGNEQTRLATFPKQECKGGYHCIIAMLAAEPSTRAFELLCGPYNKAASPTLLRAQRTMILKAQTSVILS